MAQLPDEDTLINMRDVDIDAQNREIAEAISQYESHARRDNDSITMLRAQAAILARLNLEQQIYICDLTERYLQLAEEKRKLLKAEEHTIYENLLDMNGLFTTLRESIEDRQRKVDAVLSPIDFSQILETIKKLKSALIDGNILNTSLVKKNNSLQVELSFMPKDMRDKITPHACERQRTDPHYLIQMGTDSFYNERIIATRTSLGYKHVATTTPLVISSRRQMLSCASSIHTTHKTMSVKKVIMKIMGQMP